MFLPLVNMHRRNGHRKLECVLQYVEVTLWKSSYLGYKLRKSLFYLDYVLMLQQQNQTTIADGSEVPSDDSKSHVKMVTQI